MQMEDSERHKTCDCMVSNWVTIFPAFCENIWSPCSIAVILDINAGVKVSDILLNQLQDKFVESKENTEDPCVGYWKMILYSNLKCSENLPLEESYRY